MEKHTAMDTLPANKLMLTIPEAAAALGVSRSYVYELIDAGELLRVKSGTRALIPVTSARAYVDRLIAAAAKESSNVTGLGTAA